ncbi:uncharacterized protein AB675_10008 [Cyphellophora attinorum]|uniref:Uncharacterized protein n=1 Tax=Cyphellophora attinorum TaxID=1664694 RepID=A0A0N1NZ24_9EURO|nr:uncharacterized protein AB675_10008 [Phialophora attinorum]KPI36654.1 hypothetical protein AB675_10008 [Phialophora attinorum]
MRLTAVAAAVATLTTAVSGFLIPPSNVLHPLQKTRPTQKNHIAEPIQKTQIPPSEAYSIASLLNQPTAWKIALACPGCTWEGVSETEQQPETVIEITLDADKHNGLLVNNIATMMPDAGLIKPSTVGLVARQRRVDSGELTTDRPLDFVLERLLPVRPWTHQAEEGVAIQPVLFTVVGFNGKPVKVDTVAIDIVQGRKDWKVGRVATVPFAKTPGAVSCEGRTGWSYCRVKAIIQSRVLETIRALRAKGKHAKAWAGGRGCHGGMRHTGHHGHHMRAHKWAKMLHSTLRFLVIPALLGVIGGLVASAVGMLVGQAAVLLWAKFGRNSRRRQASGHGPAIEIILCEDEKCRLLLEGEENLPSPPPRYEDVEAGPDLYTAEKQ